MRDHINGDNSMTTNTSKAAIIQNPVWFIIRCLTGFGREFAKHEPERVGT